MSQITFRVDYPQSFRGGVDCPVPPTVTLDVDPQALDQADRDAIADRLDGSGAVLRRSENLGTLRTDTITAAAPTVEALLAAIRAEDEAARTYEARQAAEQAAQAIEYRERSLAAIGSPHSGDKTIYRTIDSLGRLGSSDYSYQYREQGDILEVRPCTWRREWMRHLPDAEVRESEAAKAAEEAYDRGNEEREAAAREPVDAELRAAYGEMRRWIAAHGSQRLKALSYEGIAHRKTYLAERAKHERAEFDRALGAERPGWYAAEEDDYSRDVADVSLRTLAILQAARLVEPEAALAKRKSDGRYVALATFRGRLIAWPSDREGA